MGGIFKAIIGVVEVVVGIVTLNPYLIVSGVMTTIGGIMEAAQGTPKAKPGSVGGTSEQISLDPTHTRRLLIGTAMTAGSLIDEFSHDHLPWGGGNSGKNRVKELLIGLADHECDSLVEIWNGSTKLTLGTYDATLGYAIPLYNSEGKDHLYIKFFNGTWDQAADAHLVSISGGRYTSTDRGRWVCYARVTMVASIDSNDTAWAGGQPQLKFVVKGAKFYDPRKDSSVGGSGSHRYDDTTTYEWSDNAAVAEYNLIRGIRRPDGKLFYGVEADFDQVRFDDAVAAMNACDEDVALKAGGTEKRYRVSGEIDVSVEVRSAIQAVETSMAGRTYTVSGLWRIFAGVACAPVLAISDIDIMPKEASTVEPKLAYDNLINAVYATYIDPKSGYASKAVPVRRSDDDIAADGGVEKSTALQLDFVQSFTQAQRVQEIKRRQGRRQLRHTRTLPPYAYPIEPGDGLEWSSDRYSYTSKLFEVTGTAVDYRLNIGLTLAETDNDVFTWTAATDELSEVGGALPSGDPPTAFQPTGVSVTPSVQTGAGGSSQPVLEIAWDAPESSLVFGIVFQYRQVGTTTAHTMTAVDVNEANAALRGALLLPDVQYEYRLKLNTGPGVATEWSDWAPFSVDGGIVLSPGADPVTSVLQRALAAAKPIRDTVAASAYFPWLDQLEGAIAAATANIADTQALSGIIHDATIERGPDGTVRIRMVDAVSASLNGLTATVSTVQEAVVDLQGRTSAYWQASVDVGTGQAYVRVAADNISTSIMLVADMIGLVNAVDGSIPALTVTGGNVYVANKIYVGTNLWLDRTVPGLVYNDGVVAAVFGARFGALNDLVIWYGPAMATTSMRKNNGVFWLDTLGGAYFGGSLSAGDSSTKSNTTSTANNALTETAVFTYNGHRLTVLSTYTGFSAFTAGPFNTIADMNTYCDTIGVSHGTGIQSGSSGPIGLTLYRSENGGGYVSKQTYSTTTSWSANKYQDTDTLKYFVETNESAASISQTWTDDDGTPNLRQYKLAITSFTSKFGLMGSGQTVGLICVEEA